MGQTEQTTQSNADQDQTPSPSLHAHGLNVLRMKRRPVPGATALEAFRSSGPATKVFDLTLDGRGPVKAEIYCHPRKVLRRSSFVQARYRGRETPKWERLVAALVPEASRPRPPG